MIFREPFDPPDILGTSRTDVSGSELEFAIGSLEAFREKKPSHGPLTAALESYFLFKKLFGK